MSRYVNANLAPLYLNTAAGEQIKSMPTSDVQEVRHGKWIPKYTSPFEDWFDTLTCSGCGVDYDVSEARNYCSNCGAKMDKEKL